MKTLKLIFSISFLYLNLSGCRRNIDIELIDPKTQPSQFSRALQIIGKNIIGQIPIGDVANISIVNSATTASVTNGSSLFVPYVFSFSADTDIKGVYLQVVGANNYWDIPVTITSSGNGYSTYVLDIPIPVNVLDSDFQIVYYIYDSEGNVSRPINMSVDLLGTVNYCDTNSDDYFDGVSGSDGITVRSYTFGNTEGWVYIDYYTYSIPDRMDIRYDGKWIASTGDLLMNNETPPIKLCSEVTGYDGFVGASGTFKVYYDPKVSQRIDIYASGCLDSSTAWDFRIRGCPEP